VVPDDGHHPLTPMAAPVSVGVVGTGWRAEFFARLSLALPEQLTLVGAAARRPGRAEEMRRRWQVPVYLDPVELVRRARPDLVVTGLPWAVNPTVVADLVDAGARVLTETPPAPDAAALFRLWDRVGANRQVQVAEQYLLLPGHAARLALIRAGIIGTPTSAQVSSTHGYHAVSMIRGFLGVGREPVTVRAVRFTAPLVDPLNRDGWTDDEHPKPAGTTLATLDLGDGRSGLYDFTDGQWHNQLRFRRVLVRGTHGEISGDEVIRLAGPRSIVTGQLRRYQLGHDLNLDGHDTEHLSFDGKVVWRNPFVGRRFMDEEIAIASVLTAAAAWAVDAGPEPYPLADGCHDHLIGLAIDESVATSGPVTTGPVPWR
jgi:predicted dehydrogenase